jgi:hypothetical protein
VFGQLILPFLLYALDGDLRRDPRSGPDWHISGRGHRANFRDEAHWSDISDRGSYQLEGLLSRLYEVLDRWAASPNIDLRSAVYIEMVEAGYVDLSVENLTRSGGPALHAMYDKRSPSP